jgi:RecA-family ATPase
VIDPITAATPSEQPWISDNKLMMAIKATAQKHGCSVILVTHPAKSDKAKQKFNLNAMAGGAAYARFSQTVIWILQHYPARQASVIVEGEMGQHEGNRSFVVAKARNAPNRGAILAHLTEGLIIREVGLIEVKPEE